ncbi:hypothetical protein MtrunA17_Chr7g0267221 [Medicago truncatula]|nr:protein DYAD isoform X1 [Medicago truncatula]RHN48761.1 hypothetical protein MtrunA17_Chr7g0267221 [Medicago truncatula]
MVTDKWEQEVSLRYPSLKSLSTHFKDQCFGKPETLCRSISANEFAEKGNSWSFWVSPPMSPVINDAATSLVPKQGSCWSEIKFTGMVQWGQRQQVRFLGRHEEQKVEPLPPLQKEKPFHFKARDGTNVKKRKNKMEEAVKVAQFEVQRTTRQCNKNQQGVSSSSGAKKSKKAVNDTKKQELVVYSRNKPKLGIYRWAAERYKLAEENMLKVMKEKGAVYGNSIMRQELRSEARKYIGDTGLLDHLLKHMAGKVAPGGVDRFRRKHNAEGSMEYWLESADLADLRKELGQDPYWTPPPGWKPGDSIAPEYVTSNELREIIKEEIIKLKREMRELKSNRKALAMSNLNFSQVSKQDIYLELVHKKAKIEEQLKEISLALNGMEDQMGMLKPTLVEEPPASLLGPTSLTENIGHETREEEKGTNVNKTKSADTQMVVGSRGQNKRDLYVVKYEFVSTCCNQP